MKTNSILLFVLMIALSACKQPGEVSSDSAIGRIDRLCSAAALTTDAAWYEVDNKAPIFDGMDVLHFPITTNNDLVQKYFNQGLVLAYGFNHAEAARSFYYASKLDPDCAMAHWGYAYVLGPNYNGGMEDDNYKRAYGAIQKAIALSENSTPREQALIRSMAKRYAATPPEDRTDLDIAYSEAMKTVFEEYSDDADIAALYAESVMNLHPWDLWDKQGEMKSWTPEILNALERVLEINPNHPGGHHFYIHAMEASTQPELANGSAQLFDEGLVPNAGHLLHMPSHVYIRSGEYHKGTLANIRAVEADSTYVTTCHAQGAYPLAYFPHNYHFMAATATLEGNSHWALIGADKLKDHTNTMVMKEPGWGTLQHYYTIPYYVYLKFGKWDEVLRMTNIDSTLGYPEAIRHYARGIAFLNKNEMDSAAAELAELDSYARDESFRELTIWEINSTYDLLQIAQKVLKAEILAQKGDLETSMALLKEAVQLEDNLNYNEPPDWFFSVRHHLGSVQIQAEEYSDAIQTFEEDLRKFPKNGWALHGMKLVYEKTGQTNQVRAIDDQLAVVWNTADIELNGARIR